MSAPGPVPPALRYHDATKHHFHRFAPSLGYLDWASQPNPFRRFSGAPEYPLAHAAVATGPAYADLYTRVTAPAAMDETSLAEFLRCSMGLSAWKQYGASRWALRVNPSSGNLHPTETYVVWNGRVCHYAPREHLLEERCTLDPAVWSAFTGGEPGFLVALTSIPWREAWKYGARAFRYCQHDTGHAIAALRFAASLLGWHLRLLGRWRDADVQALLGLDRPADFAEAEDEEPECIAVVTPGTPGERWDVADADVTAASLGAAAAVGTWHGTANRLSPTHKEWPQIDDVIAATRKTVVAARASVATAVAHDTEQTERMLDAGAASVSSMGAIVGARDTILARRSATGYDPRGHLRRETFMAMLKRLQPGAPPWDALDWPPQLHLVLFVHRVTDLAPGIYAYVRNPPVAEEWKACMRPEFLWQPVEGAGDVVGGAASLFLLVPIDCRNLANRLSCDQSIAEDGFFSLGMIARVDGALREHGDWFYRRLFWEAGVIGQVLYLEAEAAGARGTGIGCFYDDPVHEALGLSGHDWQSLYHFSMGLPLEDGRLTTEGGYEWE